ncbi:MAG TPA: flagellar basal body P-ring protein FlgI [Planctomycetota bacterium]|nr:flagellar basal body P-ring protein FlgI [Planctomycetota bacterium]
MNVTRCLTVVLLSTGVFTGCEAPPKQPVNLTEARGQITRMDQDTAYAHLTRTAQEGQAVGELVKPEGSQGYTIQAESIVVGLDGRGTDRIPPKLRPELVKLLVKAYDSLDVASQIINSKDAAPVRVTAVLPPFAGRERKIDAKAVAYDPMVNLEGGTLVDTPLSRFVRLPSVVGEFKTREGLVSQGVQAYARGDVTLNPGYREGTRVGAELPNIAYLPGGVLVERTWAYRLILNQADANTALLVEAAIRRRFGPVANTPHTGFVAVGMPGIYEGHWQRYLDVVMRIQVRPGSTSARLARIDRLAKSLGSGDAKVRYDAECSLEAHGRESANALLETCQSGSATQRQSALRVLAFVLDNRATEPLVAESRRATGAFRAESAQLMTFLKGELVQTRLVEMLGDADPMARYQALLGLEKLGVKEADIVRNYFADEQKNFVMHLVDVPGEKIIVVKSLEGVRRIALFGTGIGIRSGFRETVGPVTVSVGTDSTEVRHKHRGGPEPLSVRTTELQNVVVVLDRLGVSINDIIGLIASMDRRKALDARIYWIE